MIPPELIWRVAGSNLELIEVAGLSSAQRGVFVAAKMRTTASAVPNPSECLFSMRSLHRLRTDHGREAKRVHQTQTCFGASFPDGIANSAPEQAHEIASVRKHGGRPSKREVRLVGSRDFGLGGLARKR